jgi:RimJ/RimL family protein N-acetyltransferase
MVDPGQGWRTERLDAEPLTRAHAAELFPVLDDPRLHEFTGGEPLPLPALTDRYARLERRRSDDGDQVWGNWVLRDRGTGRAIGTLQATLPAAGPDAGPAEVAWVVGVRAQGRGFATEAAISLVELLRRDGWPVCAHVHPAHVASQRVARAAGLAPTDRIVGGEVRWLREG